MKIRALDVLHPQPLRPRNASTRRSEAEAALNRIVFLEVGYTDHRTDGTICSVSIYERDPCSRIPVHRQRDHSRKSKLTHTTPSRALFVGFNAFLQLRYDALDLARSSQGLECCSFCRQVLFLNSISKFRPRWTTQWFKARDKACRMLNAYMSEMLELAWQVSVSGDSHCCGQKRILRLLQQFLQA
jgi:hypothetical protein